MISFLTDNMATIIISLILLGVVFFIIRGMIRDKKAGKGCSGCNCSDCSHVCSTKGGADV